MNKTIDQLKLLFIGLFIVLLLAMGAVQIFYINPMHRCEASGNWWAGRYLKCAVPVQVQRFTGRPDQPIEPADPAVRAKQASVRAGAGNP